LAACLLFVKRYCFKYFYYTTPEVGRPRSSTSAVFRPAPHAAGFCCYDTTPAAGRPCSQSLQFSTRRTHTMGFCGYCTGKTAGLFL